MEHNNRGGTSYSEESLKEVRCAMRRIILVLTVTAMMLATSLALPALAAAEMGTKGEEEPGTPECGWYGPFEEGNWDPWWEYWCYWPGWGWEYVFWSY